MQARKIKEDNVISIAEIDDTDEIMKFIGNEWEKGHILGNNKDFFLYEYKNNDHLNFVVSKNQHNKINGTPWFFESLLREGFDGLDNNVESVKG